MRGHFRLRGFGFFHRSVFRFWCSFRFADSVFLAFAFGFLKKHELVFGFGFRLFLFGFRFLFDLSGNYAPLLISNSRQTSVYSICHCFDNWDVKNYRF